VSFTYKAMDGTLEGAVTTVLIDVLPVEANSPPVAADDVYDAEADSTLVVEGNGILANDTDADGDVLEAALVAAPTNGLVTLNPDGSFTYEPLPGFTGTDSFTYQASDGADASNTATVTINVAAAENTRPIAVNDVYTVPAGETTAVPAAGVLANDTDAQGDPLVASLFSGPLHGSVTLNADGSFSYTPNEGYTGLDSFMYWVFDGELNSALAAVTLHVEGPAESPVEPSEPVEPVDPPCDDDQEGNADCDPHPVDCLVADESLDPWSIDAALEDEDWLA
jgi:VCBS repeat-containing protein